MKPSENVNNSAKVHSPVQLANNSMTSNDSSKSIKSIMDLPNEMVINIINYLDTYDLLQLRNVNQRLVTIIDDCGLVNKRLLHYPDNVEDKQLAPLSAESYQENYRPLLKEFPRGEVIIEYLDLHITDTNFKELLFSITSQCILNINNIVSTLCKEIVDNIFLSPDASLLVVTYKKRRNYFIQADEVHVWSLINNQWKNKAMLSHYQGGKIENIVVSFDNRSIVIISIRNISVWFKEKDTWEQKIDINNSSIDKKSVYFSKDSQRLLIKNSSNLLVYSLENNKYVVTLEFTNNVLCRFDVNTARFPDDLSTLNNDKWLTTFIQQYRLLSNFQVALNNSKLLDIQSMFTSARSNVADVLAILKDSLFNMDPSMGLPVELELTCFSDDDKLVVMQPVGKKAIILEYKNNELVEKTRFTAEVNKIKISPDNTRILGMNYNEDQNYYEVIIWKIIENNVVKEYRLKSEKKIYTAKFSSDNKRIFVLLANKLMVCRFTNNNWEEMTLLNYKEEYSPLVRCHIPRILLEYALPSYLLLQ